MINFIFNHLIEFILIASIIILLIVSHWISVYKKHKIKKITLEEAKNDANSYKTYVQKYYVTNIYFTLGAVLLYFIASYSFLIYLRYYTIKNYTNKPTMFPIDTAFSSIKNPAEDLTTLFNFVGPLLIYFILLIGAFVAFKVFLHILLFDEVLKLHLYLGRNTLYSYIKAIARDDYLVDFFGSCYLFIYNISNLTPLSNINDNDDYNEFNYYDTIYRKDFITKISFKCVTLAKNHYIILLLFKVLRYIFRFLYVHLRYDGFFFYILYFIYSLAIIYDFQQLQFYYSYYLLFPIFMIYLWRQFIQFMLKRDNLYDKQLSLYFHCISTNENKTVIKMNSILYNEYNMEYVLNNFMKIKSQPEQLLEKKVTAMYHRYFLIAVNSILTGILIKQNLYSILIVPLKIQLSMSIILSILFICTIYCSINTFKLPKNAYGESFTKYIFSKKYNGLFWLLIVLQIYIFCLLLVKQTLFIIYDNVVWEYLNIRIIHNYTVQENIKILYDYFDKVIKQIKLPENHIIILKNFIEHLELKNVITVYTRLEDLKTLITTNIFEDYIKCYQYWEEVETQNAAKHAAIKVFMDGISNIINLITFWKFFTTFLGAYLLIIRHPEDSGMLKLILFWAKRWM